jgi:hypothetical protein
LPAQLVYVPSLALRAQAAPALRPALNAYPVPSNPAVRPDGLSEYIMTDSLPSDLGATSVRIDHNINANQRLFFRFSNTPSESVARSVAYHQTTSFEPRTYSVGWTGIFGSRINNEFRFGFSQNTGRYVDRGIDLDGAVPVDLRVAQGIDPGAHPSSFVYVGLSFPAQSAGSGGADRHDQRQNQFNIHDTFDYVIGNHRFRLGGDWLETSSDLQPSDIFVAASYNSAAALIANTVTSGVLYRAGGAHAVFDNLGLFVQDEWRVSRRLNLSLGLRWEVAPPPRVTSGITPRVVTGSILQPSSLALAPEGTPFYKTTYDNFAPRFGLAYVLRESPASETVVRGGFGVYYDNGQNIRSAAFDSNPGIYAQRSFASTPALPVNFPFTQAQLDFTVNSSLTPPYGDMYVYGDPSNPFKLPVTFQWNVSVEQALGRQQSLSISYVGAHGSRLLEWDQRDFHLLNPLFTRIIVNKNGLTSDYDAMQLQFQRRLSRGLQAMASYTWSHAIDFGSTNRALPVKRGDSDYDLRHNFAAAVSYDIPSLWENRLAKAVVGGWTVNGRFSARTGFPVTIAGSTFTDPATGLQYPGGADLVPGVPLYVDDPTAPGGRRINRAAFAVPATGQAGNAPRNIVRGFGATQVDLSLRRNFSLRERLHLQLGLEAFNVLNHPNFGLINTTLGTNASPNPLFGKATKMLSSSLGGLSALYQQGGPRSLQLNIRLAF